MRTRNTRRVAALAAAVLGAGLALASCADDDSGGGAASGTWPGADKTECADLEQLADFGDLSGEEVGVYTSIVAPEDTAQKDSYKLFDDVHGRQGQLRRLQGVRGPAAGPCAGRQPAGHRLRPAARSAARPWSRTGKVVEAPLAGRPTTSTSSSARTGRPTARVDDKFYAAPLGANVKSFVWYSPTMFAENGCDGPRRPGRPAWPSPTRSPRTGMKPWCAGIESGEATGWPVTDWLEDVMLRSAGPDVYDKWVNHEIPFNDAQVADGARRGRRAS